jgi:hypothetical protein
MQKHGNEDYPSQPMRNNKTRPDRNAIEERVRCQPEQHRVAGPGRKKLVMMRLFAKMKMWDQSMFEEMYSAVPYEQQQGSPPWT